MLTDMRCRNAKAQGKPYKLTDSEGLHLHVAVTGYRTWRFKYRYGGKEKMHTLGGYPKVSLKEARDLRDADKQLLKIGKDPAVEAKAAALANRLAATDTFEQLAREWYMKQSPAWKPIHAKDVIESLERDVFADLGALPVTGIDAPMVLATLQKVEARGAIETAHRLRQRISTIFCYGIGLSRAAHDPAASLVKVLTSKPPARRWPAIVTIKGAAKVLASTDTADATPVVKLASRFLALTAQRPGMIRYMRWDEIHEFRPEHDGPDEEAIWITPAAKMKLELALGDDAVFDHPVPLAQAAVDVLRQAWQFSSGSDYVFSGRIRSIDR